MPLEQSSDPDVLASHSGGGCLCLFGLPFFLGGLVAWAATLGLLAEKGPPWFFGLPFGAVFVAVGVGLIFGRSGTVINRHEGVVRKWYGLLVPMKTTEYPLDKFDRVTLGRELRRSDKSTYTVYPVRLQGAEAKVDVEEPQDASRARGAAEDLAKFLTLPLHDASGGGEAVVRAPESLDESLRDQARRTGKTAELPAPPAGMRSTLTPEGDAVRIEIPPPGVGAGIAIQALFGLGFVLVALFVFFLPILRDESMPFGFKVAALSFLGLFFILLPTGMLVLGALGRAYTTVTVTASPRDVRMETKKPWGTRTEEIAAEEVEEVRLVSPDRRTRGRERNPMQIGTDVLVAVQGDRRALTFGAGLGRAEADYLRALVEAVLIV